MRYLVLESRRDSGYQDTATSLEFPHRYRKLFDPIDDGEDVLAVIYEPRGEHREGRMAYVGTAIIKTPPAETASQTKTGERLWRVTYEAPIRLFEAPVPREVGGIPLEGPLRRIPKGNDRNVATFGKAVRSLSEEDAANIIRIGTGDARTA